MKQGERGKRSAECSEECKEARKAVVEGEGKKGKKEKKKVKRSPIKSQLGPQDRHGYLRGRAAGGAIVVAFGHIAQ